MSPPNLTAPPATRPSPSDIPPFAELAADPEIAPLLGFVPVVRKIRRPDGWTPELQRELIARIAATGTVQSAVWQMGKHATGAEALYKVPNADSFRTSWDAAVAIGRRRNGLDSQPPYAGPIPGINRRSSTQRYYPPSPPSGGEGRGRGGSDASETAQSVTQDQALALLESVFGKYLAKLQAERKARLEGDVVAADFYLRQVSWFEVALDVGCEHQGIDVVDWLAELRRDGHHLIDIARTPLSRFMDEARRLLWKDQAQSVRGTDEHGFDFDEPERPAPTDEELFEDFPGYSLEPHQHISDGPTEAAERAKMEERYRRAAEAQVAWERQATGGS